MPDCVVPIKQCPGNQIWSPKVSCAKTCETLHIPCVYSSGGSEAGCYCSKDTVWDGSAMQCVLPYMCPCKNNGKSYANGEKMQQGCNTW